MMLLAHGPLPWKCWVLGGSGDLGRYEGKSCPDHRRSLLAQGRLMAVYLPGRVSTQARADPCTASRERRRPVRSCVPLAAAESRAVPPPWWKPGYRSPQAVRRCAPRLGPRRAGSILTLSPIHTHLSSYVHAWMRSTIQPIPVPTRNRWQRGLGLVFGLRSASASASCW